MNGARDPVVSVIMAVYNAERYLAVAIESILIQTFRDFEFLIVDDGSTDRSPDILRSYAARDDRIRLWNEPNRGQYRAANDVLDRSRGAFVAVMDADDVALPFRFERQVEYLSVHPECVALGSRVQIIDPDGDPLREDFLRQTHENIDDAHIRGLGSGLCHPTVMMRRQAVLDVGKYATDLRRALDLDLFLRLVEAGGRVANLPEILLRYRAHHSSISYAEKDAQFENVRQILLRARRRRGLADDHGVTPPRHTIAPRLETHVKWGWWALGSGHVTTARKHARICLRQAPFSRACWQLFLCSLRGY